MKAALKRFDDGLARGEAAIAGVVLLAMILLAFGQAVLSNLANHGVAFANAALESASWIDAVLQKGTLWLAFLGASLATHADKHIAIDALSRALPKRVAELMKALVSLGAGVTSLALAYVFFGAVRIAGMERPFEYEVLAQGGAVHLCDAGAADLTASELSRPDFFCAVRSALNAISVPAETPVAALQFIVPVMFAIIGLRLFGTAVRFVTSPPETAGPTAVTPAPLPPAEEGA
ncbi:MAG: TRAP transporter small permease subunit [Myxococcales bacterium]|nr:TRAP transporter small permease subunit [Myxococcales bacterium]